jgi:transcription initiation factor IIE alpha subunit
VRKSRIDPFYKSLRKLVERDPTITDSEIAKRTQTSLRTAKRYMARLRQTGKIKTIRKKHLHHDYGWCNERTILLGGKHGIDVSEGKDGQQNHGSTGTSRARQAALVQILG